MATCPYYRQGIFVWSGKHGASLTSNVEKDYLKSFDGFFSNKFFCKSSSATIDEESILSHFSLIINFHIYIWLRDFMNPLNYNNL